MSFGLATTLSTSQKLTPQMQQAIKLINERFEHVPAITIDAATLTQTVTDHLQKTKSAIQAHEQAQTRRYPSPRPF